MEELYRYIDDHFDEYVADLKRLCQQPSVSAQSLGITESASLVAAMLAEAGMDARVMPTPGGQCPVVYGGALGRTPFTLLLYDHYDVQPPEPLEEWTTSPFDPVVSDGKLYARGASDNKGNLVARLAAIRACRAVFGHLPVAIKFLIEGDEEIGSPHLEPFLKEHRELFRADACIWEGSQVSWDGRPHIILGVKGILYVELEAYGPDTDLHSSWATVVPNPAWRLLWALSTLKGPDERVLIDGFYDDVRPATPEEMAALDAIPPEDQDTMRTFGLSGLLGGASGREFWRRHLYEPTCNICGILSGYTGEGAKTVLPRVAKAKLDFRLVPNQRPQDIFDKLRRHLDRNGFADVFMSATMDGEPPARTPINSPFVKLVAEAAQEVYGKPPIIMPTMAATGPMAYVVETLGLPVADSGVGYPGSRVHAPNENIRLDDFKLGIKQIATVLHKLGQAPLGMP